MHKGKALSAAIVAQDTGGFLEPKTAASVTTG